MVLNVTTLGEVVVLCTNSNQYWQSGTDEMDNDVLFL